ncbi:MAG: ferredoxin-type protein NapG [Nitrospira sp. OLB3]|nr:MAG: ferredoxin-type protein NapG [Nitrospira sp. OLB3]
MAGDPKYGRRDFLKDSVVSVVKAAREFSIHRDAPREAPAAPVRTDWLRPPGAAEEALFLERCTRCGDCIKACPPGALVAEVQGGTPVIFSNQVACELCEDFPCIGACATDALLPVADRGEVRMGVTVVSHRACTAGQGCHACVSKCPLEALEMDFDALRLVVMSERCVGCGLCEQVCKTVNDRLAIKVTPARQLAAGSMGW